MRLTASVYITYRLFHFLFAGLFITLSICCFICSFSKCNLFLFQMKSGVEGFTLFFFMQASNKEIM